MMILWDIYIYGTKFMTYGVSSPKSFFFFSIGKLMMHQDYFFLVILFPNTPPAKLRTEQNTHFFQWRNQGASQPPDGWG